MGITKTVRERLEDAFFDLTLAEQSQVLDSLKTLHRMKQRQPDQPQQSRRAHRFGSSTRCSACGLEGAEAIPGKCPGGEEIRPRGNHLVRTADGFCVRCKTYPLVEDLHCPAGDAQGSLLDTSTPRKPPAKELEP